MRVQVAGRQVDVGEALTTRITEDLSRGITKYFQSRPADAVVTVGRDGPFFQVDCTLHLDSGIVLQAEGHDADPYQAFTNALHKIEKRVRRYKRRLKNHHNGSRTTLPAESAAAYVLAPTPEEAEAEETAQPVEPEGPLVIAETQVPLRTMPVATAVLQLDLSDSPALLFRNAAHGGLNLVYRRADGNIGWVDPDRLNGASG